MTSPTPDDLPETSASEQQQLTPQFLRGLHTGVNRLGREIAAMRKNNVAEPDLGAIRRRLQAMTNVVDDHKADASGTRSPLDHVVTRAKELVDDINLMPLDPERPADLRSVRRRLQNMTAVVDSLTPEASGTKPLLDHVTTQAEVLVTDIAAMRANPRQGDLKSVHQKLREMAALVNDQLSQDAPVSPSVEVE